MLRALMISPLLMQVALTSFNRPARTGHQCRKTILLSCHRCLINTGVEKMNNIQL